MKTKQFIVIFELTDEDRNLLDFKSALENAINDWTQLKVKSVHMSESQWKKQ